MGGVLHGVRVVEFGHHVAAPLVGVLLADQGAEVVRVDRPGAEDGEREAFLHRGKRRITLDLKSTSDAAVARQLVERADVLVENFRPGVLDRPASLRPFQMRGFAPVETDLVAAWKTVPSTYVLTDDRAVHPEDQRVMARNATEVVEIPTSHSPFLSRPDLVADIVAERWERVRRAGRPAWTATAAPTADRQPQLDSPD